MYEDMTYKEILQDLLDKAPNTESKTEGTFLWDSLSPVAYEIEKILIEIKYREEQLDPATCDYEHLMIYGKYKGLYPADATAAIGIGKFNCDIPIGARFSIKGFNYVAIDRIEDFKYHMQCEELGASANTVLGTLTPIDYISGLTSAELIEITVNGKDFESFESFKERYFENIEVNGDRGNVASVRSFCKAQAGIGGCKVVPVWKGGGSYLCVLQSSAYGTISDELLATMQELICPEPLQGYGFAVIGADATCKSVEEITLNVSTKIVYKSGYTYETLAPKIMAAIDDYFEEIRKEWDGKRCDESSIFYISQLEFNIQKIEGIQDIQNTMINGSPNNVTIDPLKIPAKGGVTIG